MYRFISTGTPGPELSRGDLYMKNIKENTMAPEFTAKDSENKTIQLSDYRGKKNVVLVFNRGFQ
jgi:peroxiredoxin